jgi:hypothetical protein
MNSLEFLEIQNWFENGVMTEFIEKNFCSTRSIFNGRLSSYEVILKKSLSSDCLFLISASLGEIGNNCFDHNLGFWQGDPGCLFIREENLCLIADRGQGIRGSLSKVYNLQGKEERYIDIAFNKVITGRAPEKRGNGLKFAKKNFASCNLYLFCSSDGEDFEMGLNKNMMVTGTLKKHLKNCGTLTLLTW